MGALLKKGREGQNKGEGCALPVSYTTGFTVPSACPHCNNANLALRDAGAIRSHVAKCAAAKMARDKDPDADPDDK